MPTIKLGNHLRSLYRLTVYFAHFRPRARGELSWRPPRAHTNASFSLVFRFSEFIIAVCIAFETKGEHSTLHITNAGIPGELKTPLINQSAFDRRKEERKEEEE